MTIKERLAELELQHKALEHEIAEALGQSSIDDLKIKELKRRKLMLKDEIHHLRATLRGVSAAQRATDKNFGLSRAERVVQASCRADVARENPTAVYADVLDSSYGHSSGNGTRIYPARSGRNRGRYGTTYHLMQCLWWRRGRGWTVMRAGGPSGSIADGPVGVGVGP